MKYIIFGIIALVTIIFVGTFIHNTLNDENKIIPNVIKLK